MKLLLKISTVLLLGLLFDGTPANSDDEAKEKAECCYTNAAYVGVCTVTPGEGENCDSVLEYLNTTGTAGKTYCGGSKIRGGWQKVDCDQDSDKQEKDENSQTTALSQSQ